MKRCSIATLLVMFMLVGNAFAGPLDRMSEPRTNPAVDDMLRIPGVVGLSRSEALITLQQAGLNPIIKIERIKSPKHEGMEGKVIEQSPNPGGVAMIGSSVSIRLYLPPGYTESSSDTWQDNTYQDQYETYDDQYQWEGDTYGDDQYGETTEWSDTPQWPEEDNSDSQWRWQGPVNTQDNTPGEFTPAPVKPKEMQPYSPDESAEQDKLVPVLKPKPLQRAQ
ncbi:MAG TPA: PASTA domain-containing protein [Deltaproteobacteria bacterium]|nr:PASTA domain-containing protein [Deltaproteobacteria bacterium]